jgi:hypothetical protein
MTSVRGVTKGSHSLSRLAQIGTRKEGSMWRIAPGVSAALLCVAIASFGLYLAESTRGAAARSLGYDGGIWRVVAVSAVDVEPEQRSFALAEFCDRERTSVAFSSGDPKSIGVYDPSGRFNHPDGDVFSALLSAGPAPAALLSTATEGSGQKQRAFVPDGVELVGLVDPEVKFDDYYPVLIQNLAAAPPRSGVYQFAGLESGDEEQILQVLFRDLGMEVIRVDVENPVTLGRTLSSFFGRVIIAFTLLSVVATLLVTTIYLSLDRRRLEVAVLCGATGKDLRLLVLHRIVPLAVGGTLAGAALVALLAWTLSVAMLTPTATLISVVGGSLVVCAAIWGVLIGANSWWQGRTRARALPR